MDFVLSWRCFHAGSSQPLDQLAKDVIRLGVPDVLRFAEFSIAVYFPSVDLARHYNIDNPSLNEYQASPPPLEYDISGLPLQADALFDREAHELRREELESIAGKVYVQTQCEALDGILIQPFTFPSRCQHDWDGVSPYGAVPWYCMRAGIDVFGSLPAVGTRSDDGRISLDLILKYAISDPVSLDVVASDSLRYYRDIMPGDTWRNFQVRVISEPFHTIQEESSPGNSTYLLDIAVIDISQRAKSGEHAKRAATESFAVTLPNDTVQIPDYDLMLADRSQISQRRHFDPFADILSFLPGATVRRGDSINVWLPITGLLEPSDGSAYRGFVDLLLVPKSRGEAHARINEKTIRFGVPGDTLRPPLEYSWNNTAIAENPAPLVSKEIVSNVPNAYFCFKMAVPKRMPGGEDYVLLAFIYSCESGNESVRLMATAS
ncbi:MAG: hypothetical protein JSV44_08450, partial [Candidatus Zixiibacteriota bacterium]